VTRLAPALLVIAAAATLAATAGGVPAAEVTLRVERYFDPACTPLPGMAPSPNRGGCHRLRFAGTISSGAAGEYVSVLHQRCGSTGPGTSLVGAQTKERGAWDTFWGVTSGTFRARWNNNMSDPVRFRDSVRISVTKLSGFSHRVSVSGDQDMKGRIIELQRLVGGQWRLFRRARLVDDRITYGVNSTATFAVRKRGLVLRAFVPAKSAAPCYLPTASEQWTSGVASGSSGLGTRVIDRTLLCSTALQGGIRLVTIGAANANATGPGQPPLLSVSSGFAQPPGFVYASTASLTLYPDRCKQTRVPVRLQAGKLRAATPGLSARYFDCETPPRVFLRIRAVFREPATLESNRDPGYQTLSAQGDVSEAAVAVRTPSGKPLAFAAISGPKARLFTARSCVEDDT
jgi:hypothetical protein